MCSQFIINQTAGAKIFTKFVPIQKALLFELQTSDCADAADDEYQEKFFCYDIDVSTNICINTISFF